MQVSKDRPQRRSELLARELARLDIGIAALSEVRFAEQGSPTEDGGYTLFWSGENKDEHRLSGVGFMINTSTARKLQNLPIGRSDGLVSLKSPNPGQHVFHLPTGRSDGLVSLKSPNPGQHVFHLPQCVRSNFAG